MTEVMDVLSSGAVFSRSELSYLTGRDDRTVREDIRRLRREGAPILGVPTGGYKLASTEAEKKEMLHQIKGRALDLLKTHSMMSRAMQVDGQVTVRELLEALEGEECLG